MNRPSTPHADEPQPLTVEDVRAALARHRGELAAMGVRSLAVFGPVARGEAGPASAVDLLVDLDPALDQVLVAAVSLHLQLLLGRAVNLVEAANLAEGLRAGVLAEAVRAAYWCTSYRSWPASLVLAPA